MIVELYGLPGAGKTTLANALAKQLSVPVIRLSLGSRLLWWLVSLVRHPISTTNAVIGIFRYASSDRYTLFMNGCIDRYARFAYAESCGGILDEGPLQNTLSFPSAVLSDTSMQNLVEVCLPRRHTIIHVVAPEHVRADRQNARGRMVRDDIWEKVAAENERSALSVVSKIATVIPYPETTLEAIVERIQ